MALAICLMNIFACSSLRRSSFSTNWSSYPPSRYSMMMATFMFFNVRQLCTFTMLSCLRVLRTSASTKILSISAAEPSLSVLIILMANLSPVCLCSARWTCPKPPSPSFLIVTYSPKQLEGSKSSPWDAYRTAPFFTNSKSSSKYYAPSELNSRRCLKPISRMMSLNPVFFRCKRNSRGFCSGTPFS